MQEFVNPLADLGDKVTKLTTEIGMKAFQNPDEVGAAAVDYLRVVGHLVFALLLGAHGQGGAARRRPSGDPFYAAKLADRALLLRQAAARDRRRSSAARARACSR